MNGLLTCVRETDDGHCVLDADLIHGADFAIASQMMIASAGTTLITTCVVEDKPSAHPNTGGIAAGIGM